MSSSSEGIENDDDQELRYHYHMYLFYAYLLCRYIILRFGHYTMIFTIDPLECDTVTTQQNNDRLWPGRDSENYYHLYN